MTHQTPPEHFKGKSVAAHLKEARLRGARATTEPHGNELPGHLSSFVDSAKDTSLALITLWAVLYHLHLESSLFIMSIFAFGWILWKTGRSALLGWARLERLHRVIEEERYEIEHHREQEKEELKELYEAKGFSGKLLDEVVETLAADDNRLLRVMLEEELGLTLEAYEHPLKQAFGAGSGTLAASSVILLSAHIWSPYLAIPITAILCVLIASATTSKYEKRSKLSAIVWNGALTLFVFLATFFVAKGMLP